MMSTESRPYSNQNINFVLQIKGTKKWTLAENFSVDNPMDRYTMGMPVDPVMMSYLKGQMAETMPQDTISFDLKPRSFLFVPKGVWYSTEAEGDASALNFTFTAPTWTDLLLGALRSRLILSPERRDPAFVDHPDYNLRPALGVGYIFSKRAKKRARRPS